MCTAAAAFTGVGTVRYLAPDPWALAAGQSRLGRPERRAPGSPAILGPGEDLWIVAANLLFLLSVGARRGVDHPTIVANRRLEPETARLAVSLLTRARTPAAVTRPSTVERFLAARWPALVSAARGRVRRRERRPEGRGRPEQGWASAGPPPATRRPEPVSGGGAGRRGGRR